LFPP
jgi:hypothetical protein